MIPIIEELNRGVVFAMAGVSDGVSDGIAAVAEVAVADTEVVLDKQLLNLN